MNQSNHNQEPNIMSKKALLDIGVVQDVDATGLPCPMPLLKAKQALHGLSEGEKLRVIATDRGSVRDFHAFAKLSGHIIIAFSENQGKYYYVIQKYSQKTQ